MIQDETRKMREMSVDLDDEVQNITWLRRTLFQSWHMI
jgi:hypothetical protein